jgi:hypothetical protein
MYYSYTVTNNRYVRDLPGVLNPLIDAILATSNKKLDKNKLKIYNYFDEQFVYAISLFTTLSRSSEITQDKCQQFIDSFKVLIIYKSEA